MPYHVTLTCDLAYPNCVWKRRAFVIENANNVSNIGRAVKRLTDKATTLGWRYELLKGWACPECLAIIVAKREANNVRRQRSIPLT